MSASAPVSSPAARITSFPIAARRTVGASIYASGAWVRGDFVLPKAHGLLHHLNNSTGFLKLTNVYLPGAASEVSFFAMRADSLAFVVPRGEELIVANMLVEPSRHGVTCVFPFGHIDGTIETVRGTRVSDFLAGHLVFFALHDCVLRINGQKPLTMPLVLVNAQNLIGLAHPQISAGR